ncbi:MAG: dephospho-CoA kinase [Pseudonocardia sp.]
MLRIGLTGGIGSGKSTVARRLVAHGAVLVDSDVLAREAVAAGTGGLAAIVEEFGPQVLDACGELDRPALAAMVFGDAQARQRLNAIVHPRVRARSAELVAAAPAGAVVVQDVPLLVEGEMQATFPLVVVVHADVELRVRRLVRDRGTTAHEARSRIAAQVGDDERRAAADVWLDNGGSPADLVAAVDTLWDGRLVPFEENLRLRRAVQAPPERVAADPGWAGQAERLRARVLAAAGGRLAGVAHVGPTAVPGLPARDVLALVAVVDRPAAVREPLAEMGFPFVEASDGIRFGSADPGRPVDLRCYPVESPEWRTALAVRDWLRADDAARTEYRGLADCDGGSPNTTEWWNHVRPRVDAWAASTRWSPSLTE